MTTSLTAADGLTPATARLVLATEEPDTGMPAMLVDVNEDRLRPVLASDLSGFSDGVTGRRDVEGLLTDAAPRSDRGRDIDTVNLCSRSGRYKSRRRNNTGGDADPT